MIDRRKLMGGLGGAAGFVWGLTCGVIQPRQAVAETRSTDLTGDDEDAENLLYELSRLEARYYTEEGVAMVLACENLAADPGTALDARFAPTALNERFSAGFLYYSTSLGKLRPDLTAEDATAVLEYVAYRDLASGGGSKEP